MTGQRTITYAAAAVPFLVMGAILGFLMLFGAGGESAAGTAACGGGPSADGQPPLIEYYLNAAAKYKLGTDGYAYLAAINQVETSFGTNLAVSTAGAIGWMQFEPATWAEYAVSVTDPTAAADPNDPQDAIYTAAHMLSANGAPRDWPQAIFDYNHSQAYVEEVQAEAQRYSGADGMTNLQDDIAAAWGNSQQPTWDTPVQPTGPTHSGRQPGRRRRRVRQLRRGGSRRRHTGERLAGRDHAQRPRPPRQERPGQRAGDGRRRRPHHQPRVQLRRRALPGRDEPNAPGSRRLSGRAGERRTRLRLQLGDVLCPVGWRLRRT